MAKRKVNFVEGEYYHIFNRGNSKQPIFLDDEDYKHFTQYLYICNTKKSFKFRDHIVDQKIDAFDFDRGESIVSIGAWTLMPNHFHIYLTINSHRLDLWEKNANAITEFMRKISTAYVGYFNAKYKRTGSLFEGTFKATLVDNDTQAKYLFSYIHLNALKLIDSTWKEKGVKDYDKAMYFLKTYPWSSYLDYKIDNRPEGKIIDPRDFPQFFKHLSDFDNEIMSWLKM